MLKTMTTRKQLTGEDAALTIRAATTNDQADLAHLAALDSSHAPDGDVLVAEVGGELWAALSLDDGHAVTDPFHLSADALWMLTERARHVRRAGRERTRRPHFKLARA